MIKHDKIIQDLMFGDTIKKFANERNIGITEARAMISQLSFAEYHKLYEMGASITPPSGQTIAPSGPQGSQQKPATAGPSPAEKPMWSGNGPIEIGMTVGTQDGSPAEVSQVDMAANGVKIKNAQGQDEWMNIRNLTPLQAAQAGISAPTTEQHNLSRLKELAGIKEDASSGATGAGAIAVAPAAMGTMRKRQPTEEQKKEYTRTAPPKTIIGDTKPNQASGELSATLAANGKKTASRINNGKKRIRE